LIALSQFCRRHAPRLVGLTSLVVIAIVLEAAILSDVVNGYIVPRPSSVIASLGRIFVEEHIPMRFAATALEALAAGVAATGVGVSIGVLLARGPRLRLAVETWVAALAAAPLVLAYPLFLVLFGRSAVTIAALGFVAALPPIILKTLEGLRGVRKVLINVGYSFSLSPVRLFWKIEFPAAIPTILVGIRLGLIVALINVVGVEFLINFGGLGQLINDLAERYDLPGTYAAIGFVIGVSVLVFAILEAIEKRLRAA
jgi:NitT/TauT family transport system permease protein